MAKRIGVYPGTFDPITRGHIDIIERGLTLVDELIVAVATNPAKEPLFMVEERVAMIEKEVEKYKSVRVEPFDGLLMQYVLSKKSSIVIRGLRVMSDFEYEFQMALTNRKISPGVETVFMMTRDDFAPVSSRFIKEIARLDGDVGHFVTPSVRRQLKKKYKSMEKSR